MNKALKDKKFSVSIDVLSKRSAWGDKGTWFENVNQDSNEHE
jgi:hypothetical protein